MVEGREEVASEEKRSPLEGTSAEASKKETMGSKVSEVGSTRVMSDLVGGSVELVRI